MLRFTAFTLRRTASGKETMRRKNTSKVPVKSRHVDLRVDQATYDRIEGLARAANLSVSEYIRQTLSKGKVTVKVEYIIESPDIRRALAELGHIGSNINQILKIANARGLLEVPQLKKALADNREVEKMISQAYGLAWR